MICIVLYLLLGIHFLYWLYVFSILGIYIFYIGYMYFLYWVYVFSILVICIFYTGYMYFLYWVCINWVCYTGYELIHVVVLQ